jgi:hypothetical protein
MKMKKKLGFADDSPQFVDNIMNTAVIKANTDVLIPIEIDMGKVISSILPPQPIKPTEQVYDETLTSVSLPKLEAKSFTLENISNQLNTQSPIAQAAAEKLATMQQSLSQETKVAEIKVSKNLNPYVIALGVVVGLLIIDKLIMKDATGN